MKKAEKLAHTVNELTNNTVAMTFLNTNGKRYKVHAIVGTYALLENCITGNFLVVWALSIAHDGVGSWGQGFYTDTVEASVKLFTEKTGLKLI